MRRVKKNVKAAFEDNDYIDDMQKRGSYLDNITDAINSPFGVLLIKALDDIEAQAFNTLYKTSFKHRVAQAKAEIRVASYMKGVIAGYTAENESFKQAVKTFNEMEYGEE